MFAGHSTSQANRRLEPQPTVQAASRKRKNERKALEFFWIGSKLHNIFMVNRRLDFLFFLSAQLFRASLLSFLYRSLRSLSVDLKVSFTAPS